MAPLPPSSKPSARTLRHQRITGQIHPLLPPKIFRDGASTTDSFLTSKTDKRLMKHSSFVSRIQASSSSTSNTGSSSSTAPATAGVGAGVNPSSRRRSSSSALSKKRATTAGISKPTAGGKKTRTRRPGNKLKTTLEGLADALPELLDNEGDVQELAGRVKHRSLKGGKGALRRKEMVVKGEMERFGASMAKLVATPQQDGGAAVGGEREAAAAVSEGDSSAPTATSGRWAALRGYISSTMEQNQAFVNKSS